MTRAAVNCAISSFAAINSVILLMVVQDRAQAASAAAQAAHTQEKNGSLIASDARWSHAKSLVACLDMYNDDHYNKCKFYIDTMRESVNRVG